ncbi:MAG: (Fe-S)-binding protein [Betaproteobacteria bacterium]
MEAFSSLAIAGGFMLALGVVLALALAFANRKLFVYEDPRIGDVEDLLPKSNCGACGMPGCRGFAEKVVAGEIVPAQCSVSSDEQKDAIARYLGVDAGNVEKRVARLACAGGKHVAYSRAQYSGLKTCRAAAVVGGGGKECAWGCLGLGDCVSVCEFGALSLDRHGLPQVDADKCTACGDCVDACPKFLFSIQAVSHKLWVACKNHAEGDVAEAACEVACTACGRCVVDAGPDLMQLNDNLAVVDYSQNAQLTRKVIERCPTGAIVWFENPNLPVKGAAARKILRLQPLPVLH